jgi:2-desacetyl-2-hydroxyethyl bacteriochlorophyllide A dehydrogenase
MGRPTEQVDSSGFGRRRALFFTAPRRVDLRDEPLPAPAAGQALVETEVSALSAGTELLAFRGQLPSDLAADETLGALADATFRYPFRYGYASVGTVRAVGDGVDRQWLGQRVFAFQPHASAFVAPAVDLAIVPEGLPSERAVLYPHMETAVNLILDGAPGLGDAVLVIGQGVIGLLTTALLSRFPLTVLAAAETTQARAALALAWGARGIVASAAQWTALADRRDADLVFELSGNPDALALAIAVAGHEARVVVGSWYGDKRAPLDLGGRFHRRRLQLISSQVSHIGAALSARWDRARRREVTWRALAEIDTTPLVSHRFALADAQRAYDLADAGSGLGGGNGDSGALQILLTRAAVT